MKSLKIILPTGLGLFLITGIVSHNIRKEAENNLKKEETIVASVNRYILSEQKARKDFEEQREQAQRDREFKRALGLMD